MTDEEDPNADPLDQAHERAETAKLLAGISREDELKQLQGLLGNEHFRDFMWRILSHCHVFGSVFNRNFGDMCFGEGERNVGLWLLSELGGADPQALLRMQTKAHEQAIAKRLEDAKKRQRRRS